MRNFVVFIFCLMAMGNLKAQSNGQGTFPWYINPSHPASINLTPALKITQGGSPDIKIAVIDTGIDKDNPLLKNNLIYKNGKIVAKDFSPLDPIQMNMNIANTLSKRTLSALETKKENFPHDTHGHGTHIAGIIAAQADLNKFFTGVAPLSTIIPIKYYNAKASGTANLKATEDGLEWALTQDIDILNYSGGGPEPSLRELKLFKEYEKKGIIVVAAAGNDKNNLDLKKNSYYPCSYNLSNIICVTANNEELQGLPSSNYSKKIVHLSAPGFRIKSTLPNGRMGYLTGTSQATAFVSGAVALMKSVNPRLTPGQVKSILMKTSKKFRSLKSKSVSGGTLDVGKAVEYSKKIAIKPISSKLRKKNVK